MDLRDFVRAGDTIVVGQGAGEPCALTERLVAQRHALGDVTVFLGSMFSDTFAAEHADALKFVGIGGIGTNAKLAREGALDILPCHLSALPGLIESGRLPVDVVLAQVSLPRADGRHSLGLVGDYLPAAIARARVVLAEVNDQVPRTLGDGSVAPEDLHAAITVSRPPVTVPPSGIGPVEERIGDLVAGLVPDGAVVQLGIGALAQAIGLALRGKRDLGVHSGSVGDWLVDLVDAGAVTNRLKPVDRGVTVTGHILGSRRLYDFADDNEALQLRPVSHTHGASVLARFERLFAINSAVEVDLTGQINAETLGGRHIGAVAGQVDYVRAAMSSPEGRSIIALPSTARGGEVSRIVARLADSVTTTPRSDADLVVTEHGVADLRGVPIRERARRLATLADPAFRSALRAAAVAC